MSGRLARALERPLAEHDRRRAFGVVALALVLAAGALSVVTPPHPGRRVPRRSASTAPVARLLPVAPPPALLHAGRLFLADYLPYLYGNTRRRAFRAASGALARDLAGHAPRVAPTTRRRRARVVGLSGHRLASRSRWVITATIADGAVRYPIELLIDATEQRAVVVGLGED